MYVMIGCLLELQPVSLLLAELETTLTHAADTGCRPVFGDGGSKSDGASAKKQKVC